MSDAKVERGLIELMRNVCEELGIPEEKSERAPILEALNDAYNRGAESAKPAEREGWISVDEQPPKQAQRVLFWCKHWDDEWPMSGIWDGQSGWFLGSDGCRYKTIGATILWRSLLPAPPEKKE